MLSFIKPLSGHIPAPKKFSFLVVHVFKEPSSRSGGVTSEARSSLVSWVRLGSVWLFV